MHKLFERSWVRSWGMPVALALFAIGVVLAAPLASPNKASAHVVISGARSLSDHVSVTYATKAKAGSTTDVHLLAFNDLHGTLDPGTQTLYGQFAGGAAYLAKAVKDRQAQYGDYETTVMAGDNMGASPLASALFHDEPIVVASNLMHLDLGSVGNHEFDEGSAELLRMQNGGCHPTDGCQAAPYALPDGTTTNVYPGADFKYLSANVVVNDTGETLFPAYDVKRFKPVSHGKKLAVGFIGEVLESTPTIVTPTGVAGLTFEDEADAANAVVANDRKKGGPDVDTWVLVIHQGGFQSGSAVLNGCAGNLAGSDIAEIAGRLDPAIKVIVSAHTHAEYRCTISIGGVTRLITSASSFGRVLSDITLTLDDKTGDLVQASAANLLIRNATNAPAPAGQPAVAPVRDPSLADPAVQAVVDQYVAAAAPLANKVIGKIQGDLTVATNALGESTVGDVIADAQLAATAPANLGAAKLAFMNPGGIRGGVGFLVNGQQAGTEGPGEVTYGEAFTVQPFGNTLVTKTMTGDMIRRLLQQQFRVGTTPCLGGTAPAGGRVLLISSTFKYESNPAAATCADKIGKMWVNGVEVQPTDSFRVTMNNFLATGGDGFTVFNEGTNALGGAVDLDALVDYFKAAGTAGIAVPTLNRVVPKP